MYQYDCDDLKFSYRYIIEFSCVDGKSFYSLYLIPEFSSLCDKKQVGVCACCGLDMEDPYFKEHSIMDVFDYGLTIPIDCHVDDTHMTIDFEVVNKIASVVDFVDGMLGFYLDKYFNCIRTLCGTICVTISKGSIFSIKRFSGIRKKIEPILHIRSV